MDDDRPETLFDAVASAGQAPLVPEAAATGEAPPRDAHAQRFVLFTIDSTCYAIREAFVTELERVPKITMVPQVPPWLRGVTNLRGDVLSVIDLRTFLGLEPTSPHSGRMLVVRLLDEELSVGWLVDSVEQIVTLDTDDIRPPASALEGRLAPYLPGMSVAGDRLVAVLDVERLLRSSELRQFEDKEETRCEPR